MRSRARWRDDGFATAPATAAARALPRPVSERDELEGRVARLEARVAALAAELAAGRPRRRFRRPAGAPRLARWDGQLWLNRMGIVLLLLGVGLLFRYTIDQGWLTPAVRVAVGVGVAVALLAAGLRMPAQRRFSAVLLGGGVATLYIVGWSAFYLYGLIGYGAAVATVVAVTAAAFGLAVRRDESAVAVVAAGGGLGTPLLLGLTRGDPAALALHTCLILALAATLFRRRGWHAVHWTALAGGWTVLCVYGARATLPPPGAAWTLAGALGFAWLATGAVPFLPPGAAAGSHLPRDLDALHRFAAASLPPAAALLAVWLIWQPAAHSWGSLALVGAGAYGVGAWGQRGDLRSARPLVLAASGLLSAACIALLDGPVLLVALSIQVVGLHGVAAQGGGRPVRWAAHKTYAGAGVWLGYQLLVGAPAGAGAAAAQLLALGCGLAASYLEPVRRPRHAYRYFAHAGVLAWLWRHLSPLPGGEGVATMAWCGYAVGLLLFSLRTRRPRVERTALVSLLAVVAKLLLVDLAAVNTLFRVLLFLGFGTVFLVLSYSLQDWWRRANAHGGPAS